MEFYKYIADFDTVFRNFFYFTRSEEFYFCNLRFGKFEIIFENNFLFRKNNFSGKISDPGSGWICITEIDNEIFSVCLFKNAKTIPVYRDNRLITTFKLTISALEENTNVIIFPECYTPYNNIVYQFQDKYIDVAKLSYKRTGKALPFVPLYVAPNLKKMYIGKPIVFDPNAPIDQERKRITDYLMEAITEIAVNLPEHTVVPYPNVSSKHYPKNIPLEVKKWENLL